VGVVAAEVGKELRIFVYAQELTDDLEIVSTSESKSVVVGPRSRRRPSSAIRSSMRQKTAMMKVLRSIREDLRYVSMVLLVNTERREVFCLVQVLKETCTRG
jgi:hypothetical protein